MWLRSNADNFQRFLTTPTTAVFGAVLVVNQRHLSAFKVPTLADHLCRVVSTSLFCALFLFSFLPDPAHNADSDQDGLTDGLEVNRHQTHPQDKDTDDDSIGDGVEVNNLGTNQAVFLGGTQTRPPASY